MRAIAGREALLGQPGTGGRASAAGFGVWAGRAGERLARLIARLDREAAALEGALVHAAVSGGLEPGMAEELVAEVGPSQHYAYGLMGHRGLVHELGDTCARHADAVVELAWRQRRRA